MKIVPGGKEHRVKLKVYIYDSNALHHKWQLNIIFRSCVTEEGKTGGWRFGEVASVGFCVFSRLSNITVTRKKEP